MSNKKTSKTDKKVFIGLSGGVDSSVSAHLLKKEGYNVVGVFIKGWHPDFLPCNWKSEMRDAMRVCAKLKIPFLICDLSDEYKREIVNYLINEYKNGHTPNPDVLCNKKIKFGKFLEWAQKRKAHFVATGHYAIVDQKNGEVAMFKSADQEKDQTYFLWSINQKEISRVLFPIGHLNKSEVRKIANKIGLNTANKKDSQGLCFLGHVNMKSFLRRFIDTTQGDVLNTNGQVIGKHDGAELYTIGERHGFIVFNNEGENKNHYIVKKNVDQNTITVSEKNMNNELSSQISTIFLDQVSFVRNNMYKKNNDEKINIEFMIRYRGKLHNGELSIVKNNYKITSNKPIERVAVGQSVVFYKEKECLGGGVVSNIN